MLDIFCDNIIYSNFKIRTLIFGFSFKFYGHFVALLYCLWFFDFIRTLEFIFVTRFDIIVDDKDILNAFDILSWIALSSYDKITQSNTTKWRPILLALMLTIFRKDYSEYKIFITFN